MQHKILLMIVVVVFLGSLGMASCTGSPSVEDSGESSFGEEEADDNASPNDDDFFDDDFHFDDDADDDMLPNDCLENMSYIYSVCEITLQDGSGDDINLDQAVELCSGGDGYYVCVAQCADTFWDCDEINECIVECRTTDDDDTDDDSDDDSDDDADDDDADDDIQPDECRVNLIFLYQDCGIRLRGPDGEYVPMWQAVERCEDGEEYFICAAQCVEGEDSCDQAARCIEDECNGVVDDDADDDIQPGDCEEAFTYLYDVCEIYFGDGSGDIIPLDEVIGYCEDEVYFFTCSADCIIETHDCEASVDCIFDNCYDEPPDDDADDDIQPQECRQHLRYFYWDCGLTIYDDLGNPIPLHQAIQLCRSGDWQAVCTAECAAESWDCDEIWDCAVDECNVPTDDDVDDDIQPDECEEDMSYLYEVCQVGFIGDNGNFIPLDEVIALCRQGIDPYNCSAEYCISEDLNCDWIIDCIIEECIENQDDDVDDDSEPPVLSNARWEPPIFDWHPGCEWEACTSLDFFVCDPDNNLLGGNLLIFQAGSNEPFFYPGPEFPWEWFDELHYQDVSNCDSPLELGIGIALPEDIFPGPGEYIFSADMEGTDAQGAISNRLNNIAVTIRYMMGDEPMLHPVCPSPPWPSNGIIEVPFEISESPQISDFGLTIDFGDENLSFLDVVTEGTLLENHGPWAITCAMEGNGDVGCSGLPNPPITEGNAGVLFSLRFTVTDAQPQWVYLSPYNLNGDLQGFPSSECASE